MARSNAARGFFVMTSRVARSYRARCSSPSFRPKRQKPVGSGSIPASADRRPAIFFLAITRVEAWHGARTISGHGYRIASVQQGWNRPADRVERGGPPVPRRRSGSRDGGVEDRLPADRGASRGLGKPFGEDDAGRETRSRAALVRRQAWRSPRPAAERRAPAAARWSAPADRG